MNNPSVEQLIELVQLKIKNFTLLEDKITVFTPNFFINQKLQILLCQNNISSLYFQFKTFDELIDIILKNKNYNDFIILQELIQKDKNYQFSSKVSFHLAKKIYRNNEKNISQDISNFSDLEKYFYQKLHSKRSDIINHLKFIEKEEIEIFKRKFGQYLFFWIETENEEIKEIIQLLKNHCDITELFPLEENTSHNLENKYWEFSNIQQEVLKIHNEILKLVSQKSIQLNEIQIILPEENDFFYLNAFTTFFQRDNILKTNYSRNNQLRKNPFISSVIALLEIISSELDYESIFSLFYNPCFNPSFLKYAQVELWNEILQKIPIYKFLDKKHREENHLRKLEYGTWINSLKKIILSQVEQSIIYLNNQEKNEVDNLLLCTFSFLQDISFFQNSSSSLQEKYNFLKTIINTYLNLEPRFYQKEETPRELLNDNKNAQKLVFKTIKDIQNNLQSFDKKRKDLVLFKELFLEKLFSNLNELNSKIHIQDTVSISHLEDSPSIHSKITFFCGFDEIHYPLKDDSLFLKKISKLEKIYFTYTNLDKNSETILYSKIIERIDVNAKWERFYNLENRNFDDIQKVKNLLQGLSPNWKKNNQKNEIILDKIPSKRIKKDRLKDIFFKEKKSFFQANHLLKKQRVDLSSFRKYIECPHKFEFSQNLFLRRKEEFLQKENFINPLDESTFYRRFLSFILGDNFQKKHISDFVDNEIFNEINLMTQKVPWGVLETISREEWEKKLNKFYDFLENNLLLKRCKLNQVFDNLQFEDDMNLHNFSFFYKTDICEYDPDNNQIQVYLLKRKINEEMKELFFLEAKVLIYFLQNIHKGFTFKFSIISFKEETIHSFENLDINQETLTSIKDLFKLFLVHKNFPIIPYSETNICDYCSLNDICFGRNNVFEKNDLYMKLIDSIK